MDWQLPIYDGTTQRGILTAKRQGLRTLFHVRCPKWGEGVYKIWLQGEREALLLGTLVPEGEVFTLERSISNAMLREKGVEHCAAAMVVSEGVAEATPAERTGSEWRSTQGLELPALEAGLAREIRGLKGGRWRPIQGGIAVTCPWVIGQPMPCMPLCCFASWSPERGGTLAWMLDETGKPMGLGV